MGIMLVMVLATAQEHIFLPKWMTPEESLRVDEIGKGHVVTTPPGGWVETPAEFEPVRAVFVTWDYGWYNSIYREMVREIGEVCKANIIALASDTINIKYYLAGGNVPLDSIMFYIYSYDACWIRDYGPWFIRKQDNIEGIIDFQYNRPRPLDDTIPWRIGQSWGITVYGSPLEHAGGNFMVDGLGTGFASKLIYRENPGYTPQQIATSMLNYNGLEQFVALDSIYIEYTKHIDLWTKILNDTLVMVGEYEPGHRNDTTLDNRANYIASLKNREGFNYRVVRMPMPWSTSTAPPSYLNSLFVNNKVLVPLWSETEDDTALFIYQQSLPGYEIVGINCAGMAGTGGAIHCITMQVPASQYLHVRHNPYPDTNDLVSSYRIRCRIITSSSLRAESTVVFYKVGFNGSYNVIALSAVVDTQGVYAAYIPQQSKDDTVYYYILAKNAQNIRRTSPKDVPPHLFKFRIYSGIAVAEAEGNGIKEFSLYPGIARECINFAVNLSNPTRLCIKVYNVLGQQVRLVADGVYEKGRHTLQRKLDDERGGRLPAGAYFYRIMTGNEILTGKLLLVK